jgi:hypothetical protein
VQASATTQQSAHYACNRGDEAIAIVDNHERALWPKATNYRFLNVLASAGSDHSADLMYERSRIVELRGLDEPHSILERWEEETCYFDAQTAFSDATGSRNGKQARLVLNGAADNLNIVFPTDEAVW